MARVTSVKTRQFVFVVDEAIEAGIEHDQIALFMPDGTPIDLTADPSKMKWTGDWTSISDYILNDVVREGEDLYIAIVDEIDAGGDEPSANSDWEILVDIPPSGGFKGSWDISDDYPAGSFVEFNGKIYGTDSEVLAGGMEPDDVAGSNWGNVLHGVQATTLDKLDDGVARTFNFSSDGVLGSNGYWYVPLAIDFTGSLANLNVFVDNDSDRTVEFTIADLSDVADAGWGSWGGYNGSTCNAGVTNNFTIPFATFIGGSGNYVLLMKCSTIAVKPVGDIAVTLTGGALAAPDVANPWDLIGRVADELPAGGATGYRLAKKTGADGDVEWIRPDTIVVVKTADESVGNDTHQDDDHLTWALEANSIYHVLLNILAIAQLTATPDLKVQLAGLPAGATFDIIRAPAMGAGTGSNSAVAASVQFGLTNTINIHQAIAYIYVGGTAGSAKVQWAQNVNTPGENITLKKGTHAVIRKLI